MNFIMLLFLIKKIPLDTIKHIDSFLLSTRYWYIVNPIDNYEIYNRFKICREISSRGLENNNYVFLYSAIWSSIINHKKKNN